MSPDAPTSSAQTTLQEFRRISARLGFSAWPPAHVVGLGLLVALVDALAVALVVALLFALLGQRPRAAIEARVRIRLAALSAAIGREEHGIDSAKRAVTLCQSLRDVSGEAAAWTLLGGLHEALGHGPDAEDAFRRSLAIYRQQTLSVHAVRQSSPPAPTVPKESRSPARP